MPTVRRPAVAGTFYPDDVGELHEMIRRMLGSAPPAGKSPKAIIAPHAGYIYSGPVAAAAYAAVAGARDSVHRVVLLGPSHRVAFRGLATSHADTFITPLGNIPVDRAAVEKLSALPQVVCMDEAHLYEHSLEVQLPFLQEILETFVLVPVVVGDASAAEVAEVLETVWGEAETLIVVSSDLSHYHDYATARTLDTATSQAIEQLRPQDIHHEHACGCNPVNGLLTVAGNLGLKARTIDLRNSGDTAGPRNQVVGYGAYAFN